MACTKIIVIHHTLNKSIDYISNPEKTALNNEIDYVMNNEKTEQGLFISAFNCSVNTAYREMAQTQNYWEKKDKAKVFGYHIIQSFKPGEVTPDLAHNIGCRFAENCLAGKYEVVVATHLNRNHLHNHIIFNSVSFKDGRMYRNNFKDYYHDIRASSDGFCRKYGLSVITDPEHTEKHYAEWEAEKKGNPTWRGLIKADVDAAIKRSMTYSQFIRQLRDMGYEVKTGVKHIAVRPQDKDRFVRLRSLGEGYAEDDITRRILQQRRPVQPSGQSSAVFKKGRYTGTFTLHKVTWKGLRALYLHYLYLLRKSQQPVQEAPFLLREDLRYLDVITAQTKLLVKNKIETAEQLAEYMSGVEKEIREMSAVHAKLKNEKRHTTIDDTGKAEITDRLNVISKQLKHHRRELKLCGDILTRSVVIKKKLEQTRQGKSDEKEMNGNEPGSGRGGSGREHGTQRA